jgi:universal stress protein E
MNAARHSFKNILLATDFSASAGVALDAAVELARRTQAKLTALNVVRDVPASFAMVDYGTGWEPTAAQLTRLQNELRDDARQRLETLVDQYRSPEMEIAGDVVIGMPYAAVIDKVKSGHYDLVVLGTRGMSAVKRVLIGSTATRLARACPVPVWVARQGIPTESQSILVPLDFSSIGEKQIALAASLAAAFGSKLHLLHVYDSEDLYGVPPLSDETRAELGYYRRRARRSALWKLEQVLQTAGLGRESATLHVAQGVPHQVIQATARRLDAGMIVMGSIGRRGLSALLIGNTAEKLLHSSDRSLLIVKPEVPVKEAAAEESGVADEHAEPVAALAGHGW